MKPRGELNVRNILFETICRIGIFMICAQAIVHFRPKEAYEKYLKLLVSVMILIQLFLPLGSFLLGGGMERALEDLSGLRTQLEREMESAAEEAAEAEALLERMTLEEVRKRMEEQGIGEGTEPEEQGGVEGSAAEEPGDAQGTPVTVGPIKLR